MVLLEFSMTPLGEGDSVSPYVARSLEIVDQSGLAYELHSMGTIIEGELEEVMDVMRQCFEAMAEDCDRVTCTAKFDCRAGRQGRLASKVKRVEQRLGRELGRIHRDT